MKAGVDFKEPLVLVPSEKAGWEKRDQRKKVKVKM
jgi:hypothetical protein